MRTNTAMSALLDAERFVPETPLPPDLEDALAAGWTVGPAGALLLRAWYGSGWPDQWPPAETGQQEYEINDVWIPPDGIAEDQPAQRYSAAMVRRALSFACRALADARGLDGADSLVAVIGAGVDDDYLTHGTTVRFFTRRGDYPRHFDDLERFALEALAVLDIDDAGRATSGRLD